MIPSKTEVTTTPNYATTDSQWSSYSTEPSQSSSVYWTTINDTFDPLAYDDNNATSETPPTMSTLELLSSTPSLTSIPGPSSTVRKTPKPGNVGRTTPAITGSPSSPASRSGSPRPTSDYDREELACSLLKVTALESKSQLATRMPLCCSTKQLKTTFDLVPKLE